MKTQHNVKLNSKNFNNFKLVKSREKKYNLPYVTSNSRLCHENCINRFFINASRGRASVLLSAPVLLHPAKKKPIRWKNR